MQLYQQEEVSLRAMLFDTACHRASLYGLPYPFEYENLVIHCIQTKLDSPTVGTILATGVLANAKRRSGDESSSIHWRAALKMIENNGGLLSFCYEPLLFTKHVWSAIALSGTSHGFRNMSTNDEGYEELRTLLLKRRSLVIKSLPTSEAYAEQQDECVRSRVFFRAETPLHTLLKPVLEPIENQDEIPSIKESCRVAIVLFLAVALQTYGDSSLAAESYLASVTHHLEQKIDDSALSPEHLLWSLIRLSFLQPKSPHCFEFWVIAVRMTTAWKGLEVADRQAIHALLWLSLELPDAVESLIMPKMTLSSVPWKTSERIVPKDCFCELLWSTVPV
jgi:hypothetical protein